MVSETHAGGIVYALSPTGPLYLVIRAKSESVEWVFPKGHVESNGAHSETLEQAAQRELKEEAGVIAEVLVSVGQLGFQKPGESVSAEMFLMRRIAETEADEKREKRWLPHARARDLLTHDDAIALLDQADTLLRNFLEAGHSRGSEVLGKQLELLNDQMKETSATANAFLSKFIFGGLIAVIALLNADLVLLEHPVFSSISLWLVVTVLALFGLSGTYFYIVTKQYNDFRKSHRMLKYKFELTLHSLVLPWDCTFEDYSRRLEYSAKKPPDPSKLEYPESGSRPDVLDYLINHHRQRLTEIEEPHKAPYFRLAMLLVSLTIIVRLLPLMN